MRVLLTATMAASALAIGLRMEPAQSLPPNPLGERIGSPDASVQQVQQKEKGISPGGGQGFGQGGPSMQGGGRMRGGGGGEQGFGQGGPSMQGGGGLRQGGSQFRPEGKSARGREDGARLRGEFGYRDGGRDRGGRAYRPGVDRRSGVYMDDRRRRGGVDLYVSPRYGYRPANCDWLRRRALATDDSYWWNRYRACRG